MVMFRMRNPRQPVTVPEVVTVLAPTNPAIRFSDLAGAWTIDAGHARPTRPVSDGQGYEFVAPGARASISVTCGEATALVVNVQYTGLVIRNDPYNDLGSILIEETVQTDFTCPVPHGATHPISAKQAVVHVPAGTHTITVVWPLSASMDFVSFGLPSGVSLNAAPSRPAKRFITFGDSRAQGFLASKSATTWGYKACQSKSAQWLDLGYGGRGIEPGDATAAGALGADAAVFLAGFNVFYPNGANIGQVQAAYQQVITNYRAAATAVGKPTSKLIMLSDFWSSSDVGQGGAYAGNSPTLQQMRDACAAAVTAVGDPYCVFLSGNTGGMPTGLNYFTDGAHQNDPASVIIASIVAALLP